MMHFLVYFKEYRWNIEVYVLQKGENTIEVLKSLKKIECSNKILEDAMANITTGENSGFTYTNLHKNSSVVAINNSDSILEFIDTYNHEKNHVEMHICEKYHIDPESEKASYLSGRLAKAFFISLIDNLL